MIFYFTGTGNSLAAAEYLAEETGEQLIDMAQALRERNFQHQAGAGESVGLVFPVYYWGIPTLVGSFLKHLEVSAAENGYFWAVITCGGSIGGADQQLRSLMSQKGYLLKAVYPLVMPENYILMPKVMPLSTPEEEKKILEQAEFSLEEIGAAIRGREERKFSGPKARIASKLAWTVYRKGRKTGLFWADEGCIGCGRCQQVCPIEAIDCKEGKPVWVKERCVLCLACINRCPVQAIQYGNRTKDCGRYHHPSL